jgi:hypothetical protein
VWRADSGYYPNASCPWFLFDGADPESPVLTGSHLTLATSANTENMYCAQTQYLSIPDTLRILTRLRVVAESHDPGNARRGIGVFFGLGQDSGNVIFFGRDTVLVWAAEGYDQVGSMALVDTDDQFHDYLIEVRHHSEVRVYQDGLLVLSGPIGVSSGYPDAPYIWWGDGNGETNGVSEWAYFLHNANTVICGTEPVAVPEGPGNPGLSRPALSLVAYPNPARGQVFFTIHATAALGEPSSLRVYDVAGRMLRTMEIGAVEAGATNLTWDGLDGRGRAVTSGLYFLQLVAGGRPRAHVKTMILR